MSTRVEKHTMLDARLARGFHHLLGAQPAQIGRWMGKSRYAVRYLVHEKVNVPKETGDSYRRLLLWWLTQRLPEETESPEPTKSQEREELLAAFDELLDRATALISS